MSVLYIETSAILSWLFGEPDSAKVQNIVKDNEIVCTSVLSIIETERALIRAESGRIITNGEHQQLKGLFIKEAATWQMLEISKSIRNRATIPFPIEPVRSLDAIHLATALEFLLLYPDLSVLTLDKRIIDNLIPLGLEWALK
jgi:predicted nucleic acid-binding protein